MSRNSKSFRTDIGGVHRTWLPRKLGTKTAAVRRLLCVENDPVDHQRWDARCNIRCYYNVSRRKSIRARRPRYSMQHYCNS